MTDTTKPLLPSATFVPAKVETKTIEIAPAHVQLNLTPRQAAKIASLLGKFDGVEVDLNYGLYKSLADAARESGCAPDVPPPSVAG
ncbi:hypothetical protein [Coralloluteibacterium stylophorae]|uniref:Uncharacterized protein n=2 Tax=Coralloluteibacterium stylophorae TaxID=1776034 RepID=A0AAP2CBA3_9GAMM|nr:hypothetical protein [Coralloluteibacterium stylophorae]MBS7457718.1 hypothetical protein [Coralloluteibacterium stylophorae]